jgi:hypothetical protein
MGRRCCFAGLGDIFLKALTSRLMTHSWGPTKGSGRLLDRWTDLIAFMVLSIPGKFDVNQIRQRKRSSVAPAIGKIENDRPSAWSALAHLVTWDVGGKFQGNSCNNKESTFFQPEETLEWVLAARARGIRAKKVFTKTEELAQSPGARGAYLTSR